MKCGTEEEANGAKAGNRGKRDSQVRKNQNLLCVFYLGALTKESRFLYPPPTAYFNELFPTCLV